MKPTLRRKATHRKAKLREAPIPPSKLTLACADYAFPLLPHGKVLDLIRALEFDAVDIGLFEGRSHIWPSRVLTSPVKTGKQLGRQLAARGLRCADVFLQTDTSFVTYAPNNPQVARRRRSRDWFLKTLDYAAACAAKHLTALPGVWFENENSATSWSRCCEEMAWRVEQARQHRIVFGVEAHIGSIIAKPRDTLRLMQSVPGLTLTLDCTHFIRDGLTDSVADPLVPYTSHFHARCARKGRVQSSFKENTIDYARLLRALRRANYRGYVVVEYVWVDWEHCNEVDNVSETILLRDFLRANMR
jgi:sugar phosphate isomerase/epimerase